MPDAPTRCPECGEKLESPADYEVVTVIASNLPGWQLTPWCPRCGWTVPPGGESPPAGSALDNLTVADPRPAIRECGAIGDLAVHAVGAAARTAAAHIGAQLATHHVQEQVSALTAGAALDHQVAIIRVAHDAPIAAHATRLRGSARSAATVGRSGLCVRLVRRLRLRDRAWLARWR